jgi:DNA-directed RNA polymerase specialized sigma24 family protein
MSDYVSPQFDRTSLSQQSLAEVIAQCQRERNAYRQHGTTVSHGCIEVFRRAFAGDQDAWTYVHTLFTPYVLRWARAQSTIEPEEVAQEAFIAFARYAPKRAELVDRDELGPIIKYLRRCTETAVLGLARKQRSYRQQRSFEGNIDFADERGDLDLRIALFQRVQELLETDQERLIFHCRFACQIPPREILRTYGAMFDDKSMLFAMIRRIVERLRRDPIIQELSGRSPVARKKADQTTFLTISTHDHGEDAASMDEPCAVDPAVLLDYITGVAPLDVRVAIERSPACLDAAQRLADEILPLMHELYRVSCPDEDTLVAYQDRSLAGTEQLQVRRHVAGCPLCQEECHLLEALSAEPLEPAQPLTRRIVQALFVPLTQQPQPLRGRALQYQTDQVLIWLSTHIDDRSQTWKLRGQVRTNQGLLISEPLEGATMQPLNRIDTADRHAQLEAEGWFVFRGLPAGEYRLILLTGEEEIIIQRIVLEDDDE